MLEGGSPRGRSQDAPGIAGVMLCEDSSGLCSGLSRGCSGDALGVLRDVSGQRSGGSQGTDLLHTIPPPPAPIIPSARSGTRTGDAEGGGKWAGT